MHICFISSEYPIPGVAFGGIGTFLISYSKLLIQKGHRVSIIGVVKGDFDVMDNIDGVNIFYKRHSKIKGLAWFFNTRNISKTITEIHKKNAIDIIEAQENGFSFVKIPKEIPKIVRMHGGHYFFSEFEQKKINFFKALKEKITFKKCDGVIATSEFVKNQTLKYIDFSNKICKTINNPIFIDMFYPAEKTNVVIGSAVFVGTICEKKGIRQLCFAIPKIIKEFPEFHLFVYGREWKFPNGVIYKEWLLEQLSDNIKKRITFREPVKYIDLPKVYEFGEICIFPSHIEVQGLVAPEAMSMQKPVIFTKYGPGTETIEDGVNGWLCDSRDSNNIAEVVIKVLKSRSKFDEIGKKAREKVKTKFSPNNIYFKNLDFYNKILNHTK